MTNRNFKKPFFKELLFLGLLLFAGALNAQSIRSVFGNRPTIAPTSLSNLYHILSPAQGEDVRARRIGAMTALRASGMYVSDPLDALDYVVQINGPFSRIIGPNGYLFYVIGDPTLEAEILNHTSQNHGEGDSPFAKDPFIYKPLEMIFGPSSTFVSDGPSWWKAAGLFKRSLNPRAIRGPKLFGAMNQAIEVGLNSVSQQQDSGGQYFSLRDELVKITLRVILMTTMSTSLEDLGLDEDTLVADFSEIYRLQRYEAILNTQAGVAGLPGFLPISQSARRVYGNFDQMVERIIERRRDVGVGQNGDLLDAFMTAKEEDGSPSYTDQEIKEQVKTMIVAGHETTAAGLSWAIYRIFSNREVYQRVIAEIQTTSEQEQVFSDSYLKKAWSETLRLDSPVFVMGRQATEGVQIETKNGSYSFPEGSILFFNHRAALRSEAHYGVEVTGFPADEFHPERQSPENNRKLKDLGIPMDFSFGCGPRVCTGKSLANIEGVLVLRKFFERFDLQLAPGFNPQVRGGIATIMEDLPARVSERESYLEVQRLMRCEAHF